MNFFSNIKVRAKLMLMGFLFLAVALIGLWQFYSNIESQQIGPAEKELVGLEVLTKVVKTHREVGEFWAALAAAASSGDSSQAASKSTQMNETWTEVTKDVIALDLNAEAAKDSEEEKTYISVMGGFDSELTYFKDAHTDPGGDHDNYFVVALPKLRDLAQALSLRSFLLQDSNAQVSSTVNLSYTVLLDLAAALNEAKVLGLQVIAEGDLTPEMESKITSVVSRVNTLKEAVNQWHGNTTGGLGGTTAFSEGIKALDVGSSEIDDFVNSLEEASDYEAEEFAKSADSVIDGVYKYGAALTPLIKSEVEAEIASAKASRTFGLIFAIALGIGFLALGVFIASDIVRGVDKALGVAQAISRDGDLSLGEKYSGKRNDEIGKLLDEMSVMCQFLSQTASSAESIAAGDLKAARIEPKSDRDRLGSALDNMVVSLRNQIGQTKDNSAQLAKTAKDILAATSQVAATANQMATSISEATTTAEEVRQTATLAEQKAKSVAQSAGEAASVSVVGQRQTAATLDEMEKIRMQMETIAESIVQLSEQGQAIGDIITTVNDIAEQSNVLAVNASIEAAKAGEHGRGFSVVAQEVKNLADESKTATSAIRTILSQIERATAAAVMLAEQGTKSAQVSVDRSKDAGTSIKDLGSRVVQAAQSSAQISASASQQLAGVDQVVDAMVSIKDGSSQIVDSVSFVKVSAEELSALSATLAENIAAYEV